MTTWMLSNGQELENRKRQRYDPVKRRKVAENRGNACEKHRASKTAVSYWPYDTQFGSAVLTNYSATRMFALRINFIRR